jgi:hypothetical protein
MHENVTQNYTPKEQKPLHNLDDKPRKHKGLDSSFGAPGRTRTTDQRFRKTLATTFGMFIYAAIIDFTGFVVIVFSVNFRFCTFLPIHCHKNVTRFRLHFGPLQTAARSPFQTRK